MKYVIAMSLMILSGCGSVPVEPHDSEVVDYQIMPANDPVMDEWIRSIETMESDSRIN